MKGELTGGGTQPLPDQSGQSQPTIVEAPPPGSMAASGSEPKLTKDDALEYLKQVKERFQDHKEKYIEFLQLMKEFKIKSMDRNGVIMRVEELFEGNPDLTLGFNKFLPEACEIKLEKEEEYMTWDEALQFLDKIRGVRVNPQKKDSMTWDEALEFLENLRELFGVESNEYKTFFNDLKTLHDNIFNYC